jgi:hypothetical protein
MRPGFKSYEFLVSNPNQKPDFFEFSMYVFPPKNFFFLQLITNFKIKMSISIIQTNDFL